jgi:hypothetical protein
MAPMILKRKEKVVVGANRKCEIGCINCREGYGHGSAPCNCIRDIQLLPIRIRISVCFCLRIIIVMLIFHVAFPHQRKSVSSSASTDAEAQQGGNQCLFVEGFQQVH